ncbi:DUF6630 family protein [Streptomyces albipurpureus]|uniref:DUF6630 domain-containing protein n=1 Tax=Streptomyces albipurpureus TaxID=2897419 RepID=A0ABT0UJ98_9ACTN|nr:DUF6630 family protein [Streptomyces sp. CWNU-1]MCM2388322.1 hypothetical protein [Streptomyces sp. CWNU-1]
MPGTETSRTSLATVAALLAPAAPAVAEQALHAHDDPTGYVRAYAARLADRGIDGPVPALAWIALVDALDEHRLLAEFDWKEDPQEIRARLGGLVSRPSVDPWVLVEADEMLLPTADFLQACGRHYREIGAALAVLDIDSDCYPVVCLRGSRAEELVALATRAGFTAEVLGAQ